MASCWLGWGFVINCGHGLLNSWARGDCYVLWFFCNLAHYVAVVAGCYSGSYISGVSHVRCFRRSALGYGVIYCF